MNFREREKTIKNLLLTGKRKSNSTDPKKKNNMKDTHERGVYVLSRKTDDTTYKIGMAFGQGGVFNRLMSYKLCFPNKDEFYLHYVIVCGKANDAKKLEKQLLKRKLLKPTDKNEDYEGRWSYEYRISKKKSTLKNVLVRTLDENRGLWTALYTFNKKGWKTTLPNQRLVSGVERPSTSRASTLGRDGKEKKAKPKPTPNALMKAMMKAQKQQFLVDGVVV